MQPTADVEDFCFGAGFLDTETWVQHVLARAEALRHGLAVMFCRQTFHHLKDQQGASGEFHRVQRPGRLLLFGESTRACIHSWIIRLLFRHPMEVQKSAAEYPALIRAAGLEVTPACVSCPYRWWRRPDPGIAESWFGPRPRPGHEKTLVNVVAVRRIISSSPTF